MQIAAAMASFAAGVLAGVLASHWSFTAVVAVAVAAIFAAGVAVGVARSEKKIPKIDIQKEIQQEMTKEIPAGFSREVVAEMKMRRWVVTDTGGKLHIQGMCGSTASRSSFKECEMCKHCVKAISKKL